jgi:hypothetical protein
VKDRSRIYHEDIPIGGTGLSLHYASPRVTGHKQKITVPASGAEVPASLKEIIVKLELADRLPEIDLVRSLRSGNSIRLRLRTRPC